ncbi:DUF881 domain-containing protein [Clostridium thermarum]|uniref:DUF881 domain-containing protein n=1 Tax=Clostridium thermarum TaxID=1716543 RepID=UPI0013D6B8DD|nr:DUF881 domain-containing protein [Clostridium thermarum]
MKLNEARVFVLVASIFLGILVAMDLNFGPTEPSKYLNAKEYQEAVNERSKLFKEISKLEEQYLYNSVKLNEYKNPTVSNSDIVKNMEKELEENKMILGTEAVQGEGIIITLNDATTSFEGTIEDDFLQWARIVHNTDVLEVVNSLRNAGAEAVSVNGQRIMSNSEFYCWGPFLKINGVNIGAPFYISAIGNSETMRNHLFSEDGYLTFLKYRGISIDFDIKSNVKIPEYIGDYKFNFAKEAENN